MTLMMGEAYLIDELSIQLLRDYIFLTFRPREAVRAIRKKLSQAAGKNHVVVMRTLVVSYFFPDFYLHYSQNDG